MKKLFKIISIGVAAFLLLSFIPFLPVTYKKAVNGEIEVYRIPLYAKVAGFVYRDYKYRELALQITEGKNKDEDKVLAIYNWTIENIKKNKPNDWTVVDDHTLNIVVRGYGEEDQLADVFTTLCAYSGLKAFCEIYFANDPSSKKPIASIVLSFVNVNKRWLVFDVYNRKYFLNNKGEIASVNDILENPDLVAHSTTDFKVNGVPYPDFFKELGSIRFERYLRPDKQMVSRRILYELSRIKEKILLKN